MTTREAVSRDREGTAMNQACDVLLLALGGSVFVTWVLTLATVRRRVSYVRWIALFGVGMVPVLLAHLVAVMKLRINLTPSMPLGIYRIVLMQPRSVRVGMLVAVCAPAKAAEIARRRGYLLKGTCAYETETLLKQVVAVDGDEVVMTAQGLVVDGRLLPNSTVLVADHAARELTAWPIGRQRVAYGTLWVYANHRRSWDSRYWGPVPVRNVVAVVYPVFVVGRKWRDHRLRFIFPRIGLLEVLQL
jgi:conjugative transfer signal peptidase TraF